MNERAFLNNVGGLIGNSYSEMAKQGQENSFASGLLSGIGVAISMGSLSDNYSYASKLAATKNTEISRLASSIKNERSDDLFKFSSRFVQDKKDIAAGYSTEGVPSAQQNILNDWQYIKKIDNEVKVEISSIEKKIAGFEEEYKGTWVDRQ